jgi:TM2 domain-containing membrane protein YozV
MALIYCRECGKQVSDQAASCPSCGAPVAASTPPAVVAPSGPMKSRSTAILLAIFLGGLGIHKFYLNKPLWGVIYLLFCFTFIPAILGFLEGICYISMSDKMFQQRYFPAS